MKKVSKKVIIFFIVALIGLSMMALPVSAANGIVLTPSADSVQPGKTLYVDVGIALDAGVSGGQLEVTYNPSVLWFSKDASTKTPDVTDTLTVDEANAKITIVFAPAEFTNKQATQKLVFVVTNSSTPGSTGDLTVKVTRASDGNFTELTPSQTFGSATVTKKITVASAPTPTPTPTPTKTPTWTPTPTPTQTQEPAGTDEMDPSGTPGESEGTPGEDETIVPSETPEITASPEATSKVTASPKATDDQALLIRSGALGFWMMVVLIVGIWVGIAIGYFIWGRKKGRNIRRSKIIGNDEF